MKNFSCSYSRLYANGGFYDTPQAAAELVNIGDECRWVANLYPPYSYDRPAPTNLIGRDPAFCAGVREQFHDWNATYARGASTDLFLLENGLLFNRCLYKAFAGDIVQMYETNRPQDRSWRRDLEPARDLQQLKQPRDSGRDFFYLGSMGSQNYGHWLIDDLTRALSLLTHFSADRLPTIVLDSYDRVIDAVREQTLRTLTYELAEIEVSFVTLDFPYFFPQLYFVNPGSNHPFLKPPQGVAFLRDHFVAQAARAAGASQDRSQPAKRLFVTRRGHWRNVLNLDAVSAYFAGLGFHIVELEELSFNEQVRTFSQAETIVGVMGAGMTNVAFSPPDATVVHLAPEGWKDPFFWDLAAVKGHRYAVAFGIPLRPDSPSFSSYTIDLAQLDVVRRWLD